MNIALLKNCSAAPIEFKYDFDKIETETLRLIEFYEKTRKKFEWNPNYVLFSRQRDPRLNRFFAEFKKLIEQSHERNSIVPNTKMFVRSQFEMIKMSSFDDKPVYCPPQYLFSKHAWKRYSLYINQLVIEKNSRKASENISKSNERLQAITHIDATAKIVRNHSINNFGKDVVDCKAFFKEKSNWFYVVHGLMSPHFLSVSRSFNSADHDKIPTSFKQELPDNLDIYKEQVFADSEILSRLRQHFGEDIDGSDKETTV